MELVTVYDTFIDIARCNLGMPSAIIPVICSNNEDYGSHIKRLMTDRDHGLKNSGHGTYDRIDRELYRYRRQNICIDNRMFLNLRVLKDGGHCFWESDLDRSGGPEQVDIQVIRVLWVHY
jgi:hypothetical protein